jgi:hypothetical protein
VSATRHGVTAKKPLPQAGPATIATDFVPAAPQPWLSVTVTERSTEPLSPAVNVMLAVPAPEVIVPFVTAQA